ncbi:MAG: hypothetical protein K0S01_3748 [Herbinix sp.]|jgi:hypothetical protein|nr:hypothetical protein [Herbinix sp.]
MFIVYQTEELRMEYLLDVQIDPSKHYIKVLCTIKNRVSNTLYINENFIIHSVTAKGKVISHHMDRSAPHPPFDTISRPIIFDTEEKDIELEYEGYIPEIIADINQINEDVIELACYAGWYPKPEDSCTLFTFDLHLSIPKGYELASNGIIEYEDTTHIISKEEQSDIAIFASNKVRKIVIDDYAIRMVFLCPEEILPMIAGRALDIAKANSFYTELYGEIHTQSAKNEIISVLRPCGGWGYKRGNVSFVSYEWGFNELHYVGDFHELAHGWWSIANMTSEDWINEGGAEFSAYSAAKYIYGEEYANGMIANYLENIMNSQSVHSIVDTSASSEDRYLNHYTKTTIMFIEAQRLFGDERVFHMLRDLYQKFAGTRCATTEDFLSSCEPEMKTYFQKRLYSDNWIDILI